MKCWNCGKEMVNTVGGCYHCPTCGVGVDDGVFRTVTSVNDIPTPQGFGKQEGWICPVCGRGVAPWMDVCPCREGKNEFTIFCGDTISVSNNGYSQSGITSDDSEWNKYCTYTGSDVD